MRKNSLAKSFLFCTTFTLGSLGVLFATSCSTTPNESDTTDNLEKEDEKSLNDTPIDNSQSKYIYDTDEDEEATQIFYFYSIYDFGTYYDFMTIFAIESDWQIVQYDTLIYYTLYLSNETDLEKFFSYSSFYNLYYDESKSKYVTNVILDKSDINYSCVYSEKRLVYLEICVDSETDDFLTRLVIQPLTKNADDNYVWSGLNDWYQFIIFKSNEDFNNQFN